MRCFGSAKENPQESKRLGRGELRAHEALAKAPATASALQETDADNASFEFLRILTGRGLQASPEPQQQMLELEALQLSQSTAVESVMPDDPATASHAQVRRLAEALIAHPRASKSLRQFLGAAVRKDEVRVTVTLPVIGNAVQRLQLEHAKSPKVPQPAHRPLRVYAYDPSLGARLKTLAINEATLDVRWEKDLQPGPIGEYIEVIDVDPASQCCYAPVDLNHPHILTPLGSLTVGSQPAVSSADGVCGGDEDDRTFRGRAWPRRVVGPTREDGGWRKA